MDAYSEAWITIGNNEAGLSLMRDSVHHTPSCAASREETFRDHPDHDKTLCFCDLMIHIADIIREEKKERRIDGPTVATVDWYREEENDLPCGPDCTFMHEHDVSPSEKAEKESVEDFNAIDEFDSPFEDLL